MWDRFEDAMEDLDDEESKLRGENYGLQMELERLGGTVPPEEAPELEPEDEKNYMQPRYLNKLEEIAVLRRRNLLFKCEIEKLKLQ